jgi:lipopolysaccharide transport system ATP-binding protein
MCPVQVQGLGKRFRKTDPNRAWTFQETLMQGFRGGGRTEEFWALRNVSFEVEQGRIFGVVGRNGAGKSTLLHLLGGIGRPDEGHLHLTGQVTGLLDLGTGFHSDLTGRENTYICGVVGGLTRAEVSRRFDSIVAFAELEHFIDSPLRTYSSGMSMRLAFAIAIHTDPELLLVDEVLAVGDLAFQRKCVERIARFKRDGSTIVLVSHDITLVRTLCDDAVWLHQGRVAQAGRAADVACQFEAAMDLVSADQIGSSTADFGRVPAR